MANTHTEPAAMNSADRCDRCGAQALVRVRFGAHGHLDLCAHDYQSHESAIAAKLGSVLIDQRHQLAQR